MFFKKDRENQKRRLPKWLPIWVDSPLRWLLRSAIVAVVIFLCVAGFFWYQASTYDMQKVQQIPALNIVLDHDQDEYAQLGANGRRLITADEIPEHLKLALYAREDQDFEQHNGVKITGLMRATIRNIKDGGFTQGGSTLSMQLIKNTYENREKSIYRKLLEIALTYRLESEYDKEEILTHYLNRIYFGAGCYGVEEAAQTYFGKRTLELTESESALLVGIIRGPELFSPFKNPEGSINQRNQVIDRMLAVEAVTEEQAEQIRQQKIVFQPKPETSSQKSYALQMIQRHLNIVVSKEDQLLGDLVILSSLDIVIQKRLEAMSSKVPKVQQSHIQTAGVVMNGKTGAVLALNGGNDINSSQFNIALDGQRTLRGAFTPLLYLAAVNQGEDPIVGNPVQTGRLLDRDKLIRFSKKLKLGDKYSKYEDLFRGDYVTSPLRVATAYSIFASGGSVPHSHILSEVKNSTDFLYESPKKHDQITNAKNIEIVRSMFNNKVSDPWRYVSISPGKQDAWCVYIENEIVTVLWLGHKDSKAMELSNDEINNIFNATIPLE